MTSDLIPVDIDQIPFSALSIYLKEEIPKEVFNLSKVTHIGISRYPGYHIMRVRLFFLRIKNMQSITHINLSRMRIENLYIISSLENLEYISLLDSDFNDQDIIRIKAEDIIVDQDRYHSLKPLNSKCRPDTTSCSIM